MKTIGKNTQKSNREYGLLDSPEQDKKTAQSARMIAYTDQEIEQLYNQPKLNKKEN